MAELQRYFELFDEAIKLRRFNENEVLREKRDIVVNKLRDRLNEVFSEDEQYPPSFKSFDQGSYAIGTGVKPVEGDFDIDEGILFDIDRASYPDPMVVKEWVYKSLEKHTNSVVIKKPCVTVQYQIDDEPVYHVDLAIYASDSSQPGKIFLARGKPTSPEEDRFWEISDPQGLCQVIGDRYEGEDAKQFRRAIRYLKRWRDINFSSKGNAAPVGIGITVAAYHWFVPQRILVDPLQNKYKNNDLRSLRLFVQAMLGNFSRIYHDGEWADRLAATLPVQPYDDPFLRMTNRQMADFKQMLDRLSSVLTYAEDSEIDPVDACYELAKVFGDDFPIPDKDDTGKQKSRAILTSSASA